jgi:hypothetical protein
MSPLLRAAAELGEQRPLLSALGLGAVASACVVMVALRSPEAVAAIEADGAPASSDGPSSGSSAAAPGGSASAEAPPKKVFATPDELDAADTAEKLAALGEAYPEDPAVIKRLAISHSGKGDHSAAIRAVRKLARIAPTMTAEDAIQQIVLRAANGPPEVMELSFELMQEGMGPAGPDLLYVIATNAQMGKLPRDKAEKALATEKVRQLASAALVVAVDLRGTRSGCEKKTLFPRARDVGDARSLPHLTPLLATDGCGFLGTADCLKCLGGRQDLREAIAAIQGREKAGK